MTAGLHSTPASARDASQTCAEYFDAWTSKDRGRFRAVLATDVTWEGPTTKLVGADQCMTAFIEASQHLIDLAVVRTWSSGDEVLTWLDISTDGQDPRSIANWITVRDSLVVRVRTTSDLVRHDASTAS